MIPKRDEASEISGRGLGTSAVRETVESLGGAVQLVWTGEVSVTGYRSFAVEMIMPLEILIDVGSSDQRELGISAETMSRLRVQAS